MLFQDEIKKTIGIFLVTLIPFLLFEDYIIENIRNIFDTNTKISFLIFVFIYFILPFLILVIFGLLSLLNREFKDLIIYKLNFYLMPLYTFLLIPPIIFLFIPYGILIIFALIIILTLIAILLVINYKYNKNFNTDLHKIKNINKSNYYLLNIKSEAIFITILIIVISGIYIYFNNDLINDFNENPPGLKEDIFKESDDIYNYIQKDNDTIYLREAILILSDSNKIYNNKIYQTLEYSETFLNKTKNHNVEWNKYIKYVIFNGVNILLLGLLCLTLSYYILLYKWTEYEQIEIINIEYKIINNKHKFTKYLNSLKELIILFTILIVPAYYSTNFDKDIVDSPFLNIKKDKPKIMDINITLPQNDNIEKYLEAIWSEQQYFQHRFYNPNKNENVVRWRNLSEYETKIGLPIIMGTPPPDRKTSDNKKIRKIICKSKKKNE
ncbi:hypothetical protein ADIS_1716 [Lunatimonas lonarensis]|uniref:Uncharacterized protein n=1 Tax=Lunatimonas lonarensis TaxID=1232681 RepID=R7ZUN7_9BACT|nr:hypothetical protein [Lunatimonas lonarensis]EON77797.1 hypothetical protein ADIS_1716 [Lunatimonas lonarensis]